MEDEAQPDLSPKKQKATSKPSSGAQTGFRLRVALRSNPSTQQSTDDDEEEVEEEEQRTKKRGVKRARNASGAKRMRRVKFEDEETAVARQSPPEECGSDSAEDAADSFLAKRQQNIKANKAMVKQKHRTIYSVVLLGNSITKLYFRLTVHSLHVTPQRSIVVIVVIYRYIYTSLCLQ